MELPTTARRVLGLALALGLLTEVLFFRTALGVNVIIATVALLTAAVMVRPPGARFDRLDAWLPAAAVVLAGFVALRADPALVMIDSLGATVLAGAAIPAIAGVAVTRRSVEMIVALAAILGGHVVAGATRVLSVARRGLDIAGFAPVKARSAPIARGLLLAIPIVSVFAALFASADAVFGQWIENLLFTSVDVGDLPERLIVILCAAWFCAGALWFAAIGEPPPAEPAPASLGAAVAWPELPAEPARSEGLGVPESLVILVAVDLLFGIFVAVQLAYLFGGLSTLAAVGLSYAEYARRGFFELLFVAGLAGALIGGLEAVVARRTRPYVVSALVLIGMTLIVLASAVLRLRLYQEAYGWTELRFWALAGVVFVATGLVATAVLLVRGRTDRLPHALGAALLVVMVGVNIVGPQAFVADRNLERSIDPTLIPADGERTLDVGQLAALGDDAVPALVAALPRLPESERSSILAALRRHQRGLEHDPGVAVWPAWNLARERARQALTGLPGG